MCPVSGVSNSELVDLSQPYFSDMSTSGPHGAPIFTTRGLELPNAKGIAITHIAMSAHMGTHVDAPRHFFPDGATIDQYPIERFHGTGIVLDVRRRGIVPVRAEEIAGSDVRPGDFVLFCFGYGELFGTRHYSEHPYLSVEVADLLIERGAAVVGVDVLTPDAPEASRDSGFGWPVHRRLLGNDVLIIENLGPNLAGLVGRRVRISAAPLAIRGADGAPARVTATPCS